MKSRSCQKLLFVLLLIAGATAIGWFNRQPVLRPPESLTRQSPKKTTPAGSPSSEASVQLPVAKTVETVAPAPLPDDNRAEIAATQRMYAAHAPLRVSAVADPDSVQNREILQTMVTKALARSAQPSRGRE